MKPYYEDGSVTIYHGDSRELLPGLLESCVIITDPPYGISYNREAEPQGKHREHNRRQVAAVHGDDQPFDPSLLTGYKAILWGANNYAARLPDAPAVWLAWDKVTRNGLKLRIAEVEFAWTNCVVRPQIFRHLWSGGYRAADVDRNEFVHPTQKPVALMEWCMSLVKKPELVVDPYMGSGTTLVAAKRANRPAIGIEIDERYCEVAARRLSQETLGLSA